MLAVGLDRFEPAIDEELARLARGGASSRRSAASTAAARRSSPAGWPSAPSARASPPPRSRSPRPRRRCTGWRPSTGGSWSGSRPPTSRRGVPLGGRRAGSSRWRRTCSRREVDPDDEAACSRRPRRWWNGGWPTSARRPRRSPRRCAATGGPRSRATAPPPRGCSPGSAGSRTWRPRSSAGPGVKGDMDHFGALGFLRGLLTILRDAGHPGLVACPRRGRDAAAGARATCARGRSTRCASSSTRSTPGRFPASYLVITGTPAFFDGPQGVRRLAPLAQRLHVDFRPTRASTTRAPCRSACPASTSSGWSRSACASATSTQRGRPIRSAIQALSTTTTSLTSPAASPASSAGKVGIAPRLFLRSSCRRARPGRPDRGLRPAAALGCAGRRRADGSRARGAAAAKTRRRSSWTCELRPAAPGAPAPRRQLLGLAQLRPVQEAAIGPVLAGEDMLVVGADGGRQDRGGRVSAVVADADRGLGRAQRPLRLPDACAAEQPGGAARFAIRAGRPDGAVWHGDVGASKRKRSSASRPTSCSPRRSRLR